MKLLNYKLKAVAMQFAILVSVIVALLLSAFLLYTFTFKKFSSQSDRVLKNITTASAGFIYFEKPENIFTDSINIELEGNELKLKKSYWGSFEKLISMGGRGGVAFSKAGLVGSKFSEKPVGLYLADRGMPLVVVGKARLEGNNYLPDQLVKAGSIAGEYYQGNSLVYGKIFQSDTLLPKLDENWKIYLEDMLGFIPSAEDQVEEVSDINNSFFKPRVVVYQAEKIELSQKIYGNIIIKSETEIEVSRFSELDQVLVIAPKVTVNSGFKGNLHIIANEVDVAANVFFEYPSSIVVVNKTEGHQEGNFNSLAKLKIGENVQFKGNLIYLDKRNNQKSMKDIFIDEGSVITGTVYCEGYTELRGTVKGSIFTHYLVSNQKGSIYINHLFNGQILENDLTQEMSGLLLEDQPKNIASWLY